MAIPLPLTTLDSGSCRCFEIDFIWYHDGVFRHTAATGCPIVILLLLRKVAVHTSPSSVGYVQILINRDLCSLVASARKYLKCQRQGVAYI